MDSARAGAESLQAQYERKQADIRVAEKQLAFTPSNWKTPLSGHHSPVSSWPRMHNQAK